MNGSGKHNLKEKMKTAIWVYNATDGGLSFVKNYDWNGNFDPIPQDKIAANGEASFGMASGGSNPTMGAVLLRSDSLPYDFVVAFYDPNSVQKKVLCKYGKQDSFTPEVMAQIKSAVTTSAKSFDGFVADGVVTTMVAITQDEEKATCLAIIGKYVK